MTAINTFTSSNMSQPDEPANDSNHQETIRSGGDDHDAINSSYCSTSWIDRSIDYLREHRLHPVLEVVLAWNVSVVCLIYYGYSYVRGAACRGASSSTTQPGHPIANNNKPAAAPRVPLVTTVRQRQRPSQTSAVALRTVEQLYQQIAEIAQPLSAEYNNERDISTAEELQRLIVQSVRSDLRLRRLVSEFVMAFDDLVEMDDSRTTAATDETKKKGPPSSSDWEKMNDLYEFLDSVWMDLLQFPSIQDGWNPASDSTTRYYEISLILPAYRERVSSIQTTLHQAWQNCVFPASVQVIVVDAGGCIGNLEDLLVGTDPNKETKQRAHWGDFRVVRYRGDRGRGPCQNFGAAYATGRLLTFLHSDTLLPPRWDAKVKATLLPTTTTPPNPDSATTITQACAFAFGHDTDHLNGMPYPWGIRAVWLLGNFRAYLFSLPYGDHIISIPTAYFRHVGGYPDQPIMEDYELCDLLRQRAKIPALRETLKIIPPPTGRCSVRRWQRFGVVYVTLVNALVVHRYVSGVWDAHDIFDYYYRRPYQNNGKKNC